MTPTATRRAFLGGIASCGIAGMVAPLGTARGQGRAVRIIVPFPPGGGADLVARLLQQHLQMLTAQSFFIENRAGAAGKIGTVVAAKSDPDGQTLLMATESSLVIAPHVGVAVTYDPLRDFEPISLLTRNPIILVVHPSVPANTLPRPWEARADVLCLLRSWRDEPFCRRDVQTDDRP